METIWQNLSSIQQLLEQIYTITQNQTTVLIDAPGGVEVIDILEEMFEYKHTLMNELEQIEDEFQSRYKQARGYLEGSTDLIRLKEEVASILSLKERIMQMEQQNTLLMSRQRESLAPKGQHKPSTKQVIKAYQMHSKKRDV